MKKTLLVLAIALMAVPAFAAVSVTITPDPANNGWFTVGYTMSGTPRVRAFALDITCNSSANISEIDANFNSAGFNIFPGTFDLDGSGNPIGSPIAPYTDLPGDTKGGLGSSTGVTIEQASLFQGEPNAPAASGTLCKLRVSATCNVSVALNGSRGGIVMEDVTAASSPSLATNVLVTRTTGPVCPLAHLDLNADTVLGPEDVGLILEKLYKPYAQAQGYYVIPGDPDFDACLDLNQDTVLGPEDVGLMLELLYKPDNQAMGFYALMDDPATIAWYAALGMP